MKKIYALAVVSLLAFGVACSKGGGSDKAALTHDEFITQADAICSDTTASVAKVESPGDPASATADDMPAWASFFDKTIPLADEGLSKLRALVPPAADKTAANGVFDDFAKTNTDAGDARDAAKAGKVDDFKSAAETLGTDSDAGNKAAADFGFDACSK